MEITDDQAIEFLHNPEFLLKHNHDLNEYVEYYEDDGGTATATLDKINYTITIPASEDYFLMSDAFLQVRGKIVTQQTEPAVYTSGNIAPVNNGWNLFESAKYKINSRIIETVDHPGVVRQIKGLMEYSQDYTEGQGNAELWYPDTGLTGDIDGLNTIYAVGATGVHSLLNLTAANPGLLQVTSNVTAAPGQLYYGGERVSIYNKTTNVYTNISFASDANAAVNAVGLEDHELELYVGNKKIFLLDNGGNIATISLNADNGQLRLTNPGGAAIGTVIAITEKFESGNLNNSGYEARRRKCVINGGRNTGQAFELFMPIRRIFKFMQTHPILLKGAGHSLEFKRNSYGDMLLSDPVGTLVPAIQPKIQLSYMSLWLPKIKLSIQMDKFYHENISDKAVNFSWDSYNYQRSTLFSAASGSWDVASVSGIPKRMYVVLQKNSRFDSFTGNNMIFDNLDLEEIYVKLNSQRFPEYEYEINYGIGGQVGQKLYMRAYNAYLNACMVSHSDDCVPAVSYEDFKNLYPIYCFDLRSKPEGVFKNGSNIQIKVFWRLRNAPGAEYRLTAVYEQNVEMAIQFLSGSVSKLR